VQAGNCVQPGGCSVCTHGPCQKDVLLSEFRSKIRVSGTPNQSTKQCSGDAVSLKSLPFKPVQSFLGGQEQSGTTPPPGAFSSFYE